MNIIFCFVFECASYTQKIGLVLEELDRTTLRYTMVRDGIWRHICCRTLTRDYLIGHLALSARAFGTRMGGPCHIHMPIYGDM